MSRKQLFSATVWSFIVMVILSLIFCFTNTARAKDTELQIEFEFDPEFNEFTSKFQLWCITVPGSANLILVDETTDVISRVWDTKVVDLPPGKSLDYYMYSVDLDGDKGISPAFSFKITGRPIIERIKRVK